ncbi:ABC transporter ATP-binding protein [Gracilibacillus halophilus YIM-C55.5]|uniref:ABC transporter ATP-binding protein n=1 Tax=Gracilibacillus halophilus YIM-C55.5 TaxID=1308866 RepID=N4WP05_9BACI|nr:ABC transporter ATP-binding protein [Gracilibacillus halophilus]ENH96220.1 ABC transporter ATP-binding protein [Gracilibacillus halophilus YIM-C55.5]
MLQVEHLTKHFGQTNIIDQLSFSIEPGEIVGLVGENGAGKSTLLQLLATISKPTSGSIALHGLSYQNDLKKVRKQIGFVPQDIAVWDTFTVEENMIFFEKLAWNHRSKEELHNLCQDMNLFQWKQRVSTLSGGMKRKLNLAISLIHQPNLLLLDEPTVGIDLKSRIEIGQYLRRRAKEEQTMILYTSHDLDEIQRLCDRVLLIGNDPFYRDSVKFF